jgi:putative transposase
LNEAIHRFGPPEIMNTDQGSQFTSFAWAVRLKRVGTQISMDGKGRCLDNIFIKRL